MVRGVWCGQGNNRLDSAGNLNHDLNNRNQTLRPICNEWNDNILLLLDSWQHCHAVGCHDKPEFNSLSSGCLRRPGASSYAWDARYTRRIRCSARPSKSSMLSLSLLCVADTCAGRTEQWPCKPCRGSRPATSDGPKHRDGSSDHRMGPTPPDTACCSGSLQLAANNHAYTAFPLFYRQ